MPRVKQRVREGGEDFVKETARLVQSLKKSSAADLSGMEADVRAKQTKLRADNSSTGSLPSPPSSKRRKAVSKSNPDEVTTAAGSDSDLGDDPTPQRPEAAGEDSDDDQAGTGSVAAGRSALKDADYEDDGDLFKGPKFGRVSAVSEAGSSKSLERALEKEIAKQVPAPSEIAEAASPSPSESMPVANTGLSDELKEMLSDDISSYFPVETASRIQDCLCDALFPKL